MNTMRQTENSRRLFARQKNKKANINIDSMSKCSSVIVHHTRRESKMLSLASYLDF